MMSRINISTKELLLKIDDKNLNLKKGKRENVKFLYLWDYHPLFKKKKKK